MKAIPLPNKKLLCHLFMYDGKRLFWKNPPKNHSSLLGKEAGSRHVKGYLVVGVNGRLYLIHRVIFKMKTGREPEQIDHDNRKRKDNTWSNLLDSTNAKNAKNRITTRHPDLPQGVSLTPSGYRAHVWDSKMKKLVHIGVFKNKNKASHAVRTFLEQRT